MAQKVLAVAVVNSTEQLESAMRAFEGSSLEVKTFAINEAQPEADLDLLCSSASREKDRSRVRPSGRFSRLCEWLVSKGYRLLATFVRVTVLPLVGVVISSVLEVALAASIVGV
jgi:hypothetical protein